ncbi:MAG: hemerythrin domain-containing protein [Chitinophagaceae bacterium]|nr:hemerythrin domain-containing protein [Chitinophagaceae bacterium]
MKRHESIAPLSRDHHRSLILAQLLKKNAPVYRDLPENAKDKAAYAQQQFKEHIEKHFEQEELMLDKVKGIHREIDKLAVEIIHEHRVLRELFKSSGESPVENEKLNNLGNKLEGHIRKEERVLFPLLQQYCTEEKLQEIHRLLH